MKAVLKQPGEGGFALVLTVSILVLLAVVAVGLLTLSTITVRKGALTADAAEAKANARLALILALGDLQKLAGADTRITAAAATMIPVEGSGSTSAAGVPQITGVWRSWEDGDQEEDGFVGPDYDLKAVLGSSEKEEPDSGRFLGWLISDTMEPDATRPPTLTPGGGRVPMLSTGTLGDDLGPGEEVHLNPITLNSSSNSGGFSWWVSGENSKANISVAEEEKRDSVDWRDALSSHAVPDGEALGLSMTKAERAEYAPRMTSRLSVDLAEGETGVAGRNFHNFTAYSRGLLTNTNGGGWRKDISLLSENVGGASGAPRSSDSLYPWVKPFTNGPGWVRVGPVKNWGGLIDYVTQYRQISSSSASGDATMTLKCKDVASPRNQSLISRVPVIADMRLVLAYSAIPKANSPGQYEAALTLNPVVTLWNPWNYGIEFENYKININNLPVSFRWRIGGDKYDDMSFYEIISPPGQSGSSKYQFETSALRMEIKDGAGQLGPGETRIYSPESPSLTDVRQGGGNLKGIVLEPGYRTFGGFRFKLPIPGKRWQYISGGKNDRIHAALDVNQLNIGKQRGRDAATGLYIRSHVPGFGSITAHRMHFDPKIAAEFYDPLDFADTPSTTFADAAASNQVFASWVYTCRTANDTSFPGRGAFQFNPNTLYTELGLKAFTDWESKDPDKGVYPGAMHPVNSPYEIQFFAHSGWNDSLTPNEGPHQRGYVATGLAANNGLDRCVLNEVPLRPISSLGELQHFHARGENQYPPFRTNIIGNSTAYALVPPESTTVPMPDGTSPDKVPQKQFDDSYCLNRVLFDDWFVSSIAPETSAWSGKVSRSLEEVYSAHVAGTKPLPNSQYLASSNANLSNPKDDVKAADSWSTIASRLMVDGMFNVNSTSVDAWRSLLSHARDHVVPRLDGKPDSGALGLGDEEGHPVSRTTVAGNLSSDGDLFGYELFAGYRRLTDDQIDALAAGIVAQIRRRGPALSLSEFINRQLRPASDQDADLALAGPIQAALDELGRLGSTDPLNLFGELQELCRKTEPMAGADYEHPAAAEGWTGEGLPGWITQADILRPLAPVLSARDDTFTIRAYGEARNSVGSVTARAWCEAVVERRGNYVAPDPDLGDATDDANMESGRNMEINRRFGRRFEIVSFRWLSPEEV